MIELLLVVTLMAMLVGLGAVALRTPPARVHRQAMQHIAQVSRYLFKYAQEHNEDMWMMFDLRKNVWYVEKNQIDGQFIERVKFTNELIEEENELPDDLNIKDLQVASSGRHSVGQIGISILPRGFIEPAILHVVSDLDERREFSLVFMPLLGFVEIEEGYRELNTGDACAF